MSIWTEEEKAIFLEKYLLYPKMFGKIATFLEDKGIEDAINYYYANKMTLNLKKLLKEQQSKRKGFQRKTAVVQPRVPRSFSLLFTPFN